MAKSVPFNISLFATLVSLILSQLALLITLTTSGRSPLHNLVIHRFYFSGSLKALEEEIWKVLSNKAANFNIIMDGVSILHLEVESKSTDVTEATPAAALEAETERPKFDEENAEQEKEAEA